MFIDKLRTPKYKLVFGVLSISPIIVLIVAVTLGGQLLSWNTFDNKLGDCLKENYLYLTLILNVLVISFVVIVYSIDSKKSHCIPDEKRPFWPTRLILGHLVAIVIYYYLYILFEHPEEK